MKKKEQKMDPEVTLVYSFKSEELPFEPSFDGAKTYVEKEIISKYPGYKVEKALVMSEAVGPEMVPHVQIKVTLVLQEG